MNSQVRHAVSEMDDAVDRAFDHLRGRPWADRLFYTASELGDFSKIWQVTGLVRSLLPDRSHRSATRLSIALGAESLLVNGVIKSLIGRKRPQEAVDRPHYLRQPRTSSFPSGHASSAFMAATVLAERDRALAPLYFAMAAVVASSRVYVKIHHASDVVAGAALGVGLGIVVRRVAPLDRFT